jgi:maltooligosyltrehalose trehalohydrolase
VPQQKLAAVLKLSSPFLPLLFMGEEYGEIAPFFFFTSFDDVELANAVREGRKKELAAHYSEDEFVDPQAQETFDRSRLDWSKLETSPYREIVRLHRGLLSLRRQHPSLNNCRKDLTEIQFDEHSKFYVMKRADPSGDAALVVCNFSGQPQKIPVPGAPQGWQLALSTADSVYDESADPNPSASSPAVSNSAKKLPADSNTTVALAPFECAIYISKK